MRLLPAIPLHRVLLIVAASLCHLAHAYQQSPPSSDAREAAEFEVAKRLPSGQAVLPVERYFAARAHSQAMPKRPQPNAGARSAGKWKNLGPGNLAGRTRAILIDPDTPTTMYVAGEVGGVFKSTDGGSSWNPVGDLLPALAVSSLAMDPHNSSVIYAGTGEGNFHLGAARGAGIFKSADGGASWTALGNTTSDRAFYFVNKLAVSPLSSDRIYAATGAGILRSIDGGATWTLVVDASSVHGCFDLAMRTDTAADYIFAACGNFAQGAIYRNTDAAGAGSWSVVYSEADMGLTSLAIAPSSQSTIYALSASIAAGDSQDGLLALFRSTGSGDPGSWTARVRNTGSASLNTLLLSNPIRASMSACGFGQSNSMLNHGWYANTLAVDPGNPNTLWAGGVDLFRSDDGGANWGLASYWWDKPGNARYVHADQHAIAFHPQYNGTANQTMYVANDGGIFRTDGARAAVATSRAAACAPSGSSVSWTSLDNGLRNARFYDGTPYPDGSAYLGAAQASGVLRGADSAGAVWNPLLGGDGVAVAVDPRNTNTIYAERAGLSIEKSTDGGVHWKKISSGIGAGDGFLFLAPLALDPNNSQQLWMGGPFLYRSTDAAASWTQASAALSGSLSAIAVAPGDSNTVAAGDSNGHVYVSASALSATAGTPWPASQPRTGFVSALVFDPADRNTIYAAYSTFKASPSDAHVYRSSDGGSTWTAIDGSGASGLPDVPVHSIVVNPSDSRMLFAGTDVGLYSTSDGGASWNREVTPFGEAPTVTLKINTVNGTGYLYAFTSGSGVWRTALDPATTQQFPNLSINKSHTSTFYQGLQNGEYVITVSNGGPATTSGTVTVTETVPSGITATSMTGNGWNCTQPSGPCTQSTPLSAGQSYQPINLLVNVAPDAPASVQNTAKVTGGGDANIHFGLDPTDILPSPNLSINKTHTSTFYQGLTGGTYLISVSNGGPGPTTSGVTVTDNLPSGLTATAILGSGWNCTQPSGPCMRSDVLNSGLTYPAINLTVNVDPAAPASLTNTATLMGGGDANTHTAMDVTNILPSPNLSINKSHTSTFYQGLTGGNYIITVSNGGPGPTTSAVTVTDTLPSGLTATSMQGQGWNCTQPSGPCMRSDVLNSGLSYPTITLAVNVAPNAPASVQNTAKLTGGGDANTHFGLDPTDILPSPNLSLNKTHTTSFYQGLTGGNYLLSVSNGGPGPTTSAVTVTDNLPSSLTATSIQGQGWTCTQPSGPCTRSDALNSGLTYPAITLTVNVAANAPGQVTNTASLSGGGDANTHTATDVTTISTRQPSLSITKSHSGTFSQGQTGAAYTIAVSNIGQGTTGSTVSVSDSVPAGLTATSIGGNGWNCAQPAGPCTRSDALQGGGSYPAITLLVNVSTNAPSSVTNSATVSGGGDPNSHTANDVTSIGSATPNLTITKTHSGSFTQGETGALYTIAIANAGAGPTSGSVTVMDNVPTGLTATSIAGSGWSCTQPAGPCTRSDVLQGGVSYPVIQLSASVSVNAPASVTNTATVTCCNQTLKTGIDVTQINQALGITKTHSGNFTQGQTGAMYTITVVNNGQGPINGATVTDGVPAGLTATSIAGSGWSCSQPAGPCMRGDVLQAGATYPVIQLYANVSATAPSTVVNMATVTCCTNLTATATDTTTITQIPASLSITKTHSGVFSQGQSGVIYTIAVTDNGQAPTSGPVTVTDNVPSGLTATSIAGSGWSCTQPAGPCTRSDVLQAGATYPVIQLSANVSVNAPPTVLNTATVTCCTSLTATATDIAQVVPVVLSITKTHVGTFTPGQSGAVFTIAVTDSGQVPTFGVVTVTDAVPTGLTATSIAGSGWSCTQPAGPCTRSDVLQAGASYPVLQLSVNVAASPPPSVTNTATVTCCVNVTQTATDTVTFSSTPPSLSISKSHTGNFTLGQMGATYTLTVSNASGAGPTAGTVTVTETPPPGLTLVSMAGTGWTCPSGGNTCTRNDTMNGGQSYPPITVTVNVSASAAGFAPVAPGTAPDQKQEGH